MEERNEKWERNENINKSEISMKIIMKLHKRLSRKRVDMWCNPEEKVCHFQISLRIFQEAIFMLIKTKNSDVEGIII